MPSVKVFFDGGCRPNPGPIEIAAVVGGVAYVETEVGVGSNGEAEWRALLHAASVASRLGLSDVIFIGDSAMVIDQAAGRAKFRTPEHLAAFQSASAGFSRVRLRRIGRAQNLAGIALAARHPR